MIKRFTAWLMAALLFVSLLFTGGSPALAAAGGNCTSGGFVCLYQWLNRGAQVSGNRWQSSMSNIYAHSNHCVSLLSPVATWANGTEVYHNSGSYMQTSTSAYGNYFVYLWGNSNCTGSIGGHLITMNTGVGYIWDDLRDLDAYHEVGSVQLVYVG